MSAAIIDTSTNDIGGLEIIHFNARPGALIHASFIHEKGNRKADHRH